MTHPIPRILTVGPGGFDDPGMVVAGSRAGALGVLDAGFRFDEESCVKVAEHIARYLGDRSFGLRVPGEAFAGQVLWLDRLPAGLSLIIVDGISGGDEGRFFELIRRSGRRGMAEVTTRAGAVAAARAGFDGLTLAGHEAGGHGSDEGSFIFLQAILREPAMPLVWVRGGIGPNAAAACIAVGAAGVVLDGALLLARESPLDRLTRERLARFDGGDPIVIRPRNSAPVRILAAPGSGMLARLREAAEQGGDTWNQAVRQEVGWGPGRAWPVGQDAAWAEALARRFVTTGGIIQAVERAIEANVRSARTFQPLAEGSPLAQAHGTTFPIVQGPMTRVSDTVAFAQAVAEGGALPFLALALMRGTDVEALLAEASSTLAGRPWGVGILGFVPPELRREQVEAIRRSRPPFALIAGGRPDQVCELEKVGIATYMHSPSPGLLRHALSDGARRFVLEGRECGGHVGPRSSLVLWEQAIEVFLDAIDECGVEAESLHVLFAGGVHDSRSAAMVATLAAPLAERGVRIGVLIGTAYLFTAEAVATGAIVPGFQAEALRCTGTVLLETGPGHEVRVSPTPFTSRFEEERRRFLTEKRPAEEVRNALEGLNAGRLRVAAKGIDRSQGAGSALLPVADDEQKARGLYMLGQAATLRDRVTTIAELHQEISKGGAELVAGTGAGIRIEAQPETTPSDIALVGMSAIVPGAGDLRTYWENTLRGFDAITEVPEDRWDWRLYFDPDPRAPDRITSKWGGFLPDVPFDPLRYGMPPTSLPSIEPLHLLTLEAVRVALNDAGYRDRPFPRERTAVVLGAGGGAAQLAMGYAFRSYLPLLDTVIPGAGREALERVGALLPEWTEDSFPGILLNVAAGRVANRFDLGGANYTVDAACGSSLAAAMLAVRELESGAADMVVLGGADTVQNPFTYLAFSKTHAFSTHGRCRPFDASADGIVISEAVAVVVLKRLADAERDGDRIYAVIKGLGASSDGRAKGLTAPRPEGQIRALRRAYAKAGVSPATVGYIEAHGTGTAAGDLAEFEALSEVFREAGAERRTCALGSVKSLIGHTKCAAGLAGLINAALALHYRVLPPTIGVNRPNPRVDFDASPFHISAQTRPWLHSDPAEPRRAGVSAFGFGGTNFHAVLEAYEMGPLPTTAPHRGWPAELLVWKAPDRASLSAELARLARTIEGSVAFTLRDLVFTLFTALDDTSLGPLTLAIVASSFDDLRTKLAEARRRLGGTETAWHDPRGIVFAERPVAGKLAFLFPGQGAQQTEMLGELAVAFDEVRAGFEQFDAALKRLGRRPIGPLVFPPPAFTDDERTRQKETLAALENAQPGLGAACIGLLGLLRSLGVEPAMVGGHSYGELVALHAAGVLSAGALAELSEARGRFLHVAVGDEPGAMAALAVGPDGIAAVLDGIEGVSPVNWNGPAQTVISGTRAAVEQALGRARRLGVRGIRLPVACAFHSPLVASATAPLAELAARLNLRPPDRPVYSNVTAAPYSADVEAIAAQIGEHLAHPVLFASMVEAMHEAGARVFVEVGPGATLSPLISTILNEKPHLTVSTDPPGRRGLTGLLSMLARLFVAGVPIRFDRLTEGRAPRRLDPSRWTIQGETDAPTPSTWLVNGTRARPASGPEPPRLGSGTALPIPLATNGTDESPFGRNGHADYPPRSRNGTPRPGSIPSVPITASSSDERDRVVAAFQKTMQRFLDLQRTTMLRFLGQTTDHSPSHVIEEPLLHGVGTTLSANEEGEQGPHHEAGSEPSPALVEESLADRLLAIVRDRTGYPTTMLRLDLDLEADLGIDSIKRVEILGSLRDAIPGLGAQSDSTLMDRLTRSRTLGEIVLRLEEAVVEKNDTASEEEAREPESEGVRRRVLDVVETPLEQLGHGQGLAARGTVLVTDDHRGVARAVVFDLRARGYRAVRVHHGDAPVGVGEGDGIWVDLTSPAEVARVVDHVRSSGRGPLAGIVHALPLRSLPPAELDPSAWASRMGPEVRGLFLLAKASADDLAHAARQGGSCLIAATALGGGFMSAGESSDEAFPGQGAVAGLVKTLAREWPEVRTRVVDFDPTDEVEVIAANLVQELLANDRRAEVGYLGRRRIALRAVGVELDTAVDPQVELTEGEPILITGGARGITASIALDLARRWRPTLLLVGKSPLPGPADDPELAGLDSAAALKAALHRRLAWRATGRPVSPNELERAYQAHRREREIRANLNAFRAAGATVAYAQADVRDASAMGRLLAGWRRQYGPIAGLIHGAGVIQDKLLRDKSPESFDQVLGTKVDGALMLARLLDGEPPRFTAFFSSVAGRFGNPGQTDYAAANEALSKLAIWLDRRWPGRVVSMIWGPWSGVGMVSDLESHLGRRGLGMIRPTDGVSRLGDELQHGRKGVIEVIVAGALGSLADDYDPESEMTIHS
jgi:acyl transferase domain-containing protein/NAD(P)-dependent dehydrogenase (short-subunit alcohol dehydrogenase family)